MRAGDFTEESGEGMVLEVPAGAGQDRGKAFADAGQTQRYIFSSCVSAGDLVGIPLSYGSTVAF